DPTYGYLTSVTITNPGSGYGIAPVTVGGAGASGAGATGYQVVDGMVTGGTVTDPGVGYFANPNVTASRGGYDTGSGATTSTVLTAQNNVYVRSITVTSGGSLWAYAPDVTI